MLRVNLIYAVALLAVKPLSNVVIGDILHFFRGVIVCLIFIHWGSVYIDMET